MTVVLLFTAWAGIRGLTFDAIWYDEFRSLFYIGVTADSPPSLLNTLNRVITESDALNPPAYYLLLTIWTQFTGIHPVAARYLSVMLGVLTAAFVYRIGTDVDSPITGIFAAVLLSTLALFTIYMHEIRAYAFAALLVVIHLWLYWCCLRPNSPRADKILLTLITAAMLYTHYTAGLLAAGTAFYHLIVFRRRLWLLLAYVAAAVLFFPWLNIVFATAAMTEIESRTQFGKSAFEVLTTIGIHYSNGFWYFSVIPLLLALRGKWLLWTFFTIGLLGILTLNAVYPFVSNARYILVLIPPLTLIAAYGLSWRPLLGAIFLAAWIIAGIPQRWDLTYTHEVINSPRWHLAWDHAAAEVVPQLEPDDMIVVLLPGGINNWTHTDVAAYYFPDTDVYTLHTFTYTDPITTVAEITDNLPGHHRLWLIQFPSQYRAYNHAYIEDFLIGAYGDPLLTRHTDQIDVQLFEVG